jgi:hypothetical protein
MPLSTRILDQLATTTSELTFIGIGWHLATAAVAIALFAGWKPSTRHTALLLIMPILSVATISTAYSSWFNAISFTLLALLLTIGLDDAAPRWHLHGPAWSRLLGIALIVYGFCYPHFVAGAWYRALYAAPLGVVPCPTLAVVVGFTLLGPANGSRTIPTLLAVWTTFYAVFGIAVLGVVLDTGLLVGAIGITVLAVQNRRAVGRTRAPTAIRREGPAEAARPL